MYTRHEIRAGEGSSGIGMLVWLPLLLPGLQGAVISWPVSGTEEVMGGEARDVEHCGPQDLVPPDRVNTSLQLQLLRQQLALHQLDSLFVPIDRYSHSLVFVRNHTVQNDREGRLKWISGFSGSAGQAIVTADQGRIFLLTTTR